MPRSNPARFHILVAIFATIWLAASPAVAADKPFLLHLPGIGGHMRIDDNVTEGMRRGGLDAQVRIHDWTNGNPGLPALGGYDRNRAEAKTITAELLDIARADPQRRIIITSHSGGGAMAIWALEDLPEDVKIDTLVMLAPAISPDYDLSKALSHVKGKAYAFSSNLDAIDGFGTKTFGTMDRIKTESAGYGGFVMPQTADAAQYAKLLNIPYDRAWLRYGNAGEHIGTMTPAFAAQVLAPLILTGQLHKPATLPSTRPTPAPAEF
jgi:pimeloyl-ACP methyl ester carboxylesterase